MKTFKKFPVLNATRLGNIAHSVSMISRGTCNNTIICDGVTVKKVPSDNPKKYSVQVIIEIEEEEE